MQSLLDMLQIGEDVEIQIQNDFGPIVLGGECKLSLLTDICLQIA